MKFLNEGNRMVAYATEDNEKGTLFKEGEVVGNLNYGTGKFRGATICLVEIHKEAEPFIKAFEQGKVKKKIEKAKKLLADNGYAVESLWSAEDVQNKYYCDKDEAMDIINQILGEESLTSQINEAICDDCEESGFKEKEDDNG